MGTGLPDDAHGTDIEFLRSVLASSADCIKVLDLDANLVFMTEAGRRLMEVSDFNAIRGCPWPDFWQGQDNLAAKAAFAAALAGGVGHFQGQASTMAGTPRWWDVQVTPILGADGRPAKILSVSRDVTAQKVAEDRQALLHQELAHRVKNTLAMVQAIATQTLRDDVSPAAARESFTARIIALSKAHDMLLQADWMEASLPALVRSVASHHGQVGPDRIRISGADVQLGPKAALAFALALHELGTNAVKYGALSVPEGRIDISWTISSGAAPRLAFGWQESGGPPVSTPTRKGFGTRLIDRTLASTLGAAVVLAYRPAGLTLTVDGPVTGLQEG